jgi:hypothetical protein
MSNEVETKVLDVDPEKVRQKLDVLGAEKVLDTILIRRTGYV